MATLNDRQNKGLPKPPAPPRRGANPWRLSNTARKPEPVRPTVTPDLLVELMKRAPAEEPGAEREAPQEPGAAPKRPGLIGLVIVLIAVSIVARMFLDSRGDRDWVRIIGPLVAIAFIAHGIWRMRQRRGTKKTKPD
jgi:uncharacterized membrane protein